MTWKGFQINEKYYDVSHLQTFEMPVTIDGEEIMLKVSFGNHCFTDEKENGPLIFKSEGRYWSQERYESSINLPTLLRDGFITSYAIPYYAGKRRKEKFHYMEQYDYAIFFEIRKSEGEDKTLKIKVVSAYEVEQWGKGTMPKGKPKKVSWILSRKLQNKKIQ
jgi:hypothetical protein